MNGRRAQRVKPWKFLPEGLQLVEVPWKFLPEGLQLVEVPWKFLPEGLQQVEVPWKFLPEGSQLVEVPWKFLPEGSQPLGVPWKFLPEGLQLLEVPWKFLPEASALQPGRKWKDSGGANECAPLMEESGGRSLFYFSSLSDFFFSLIFSAIIFHTNQTTTQMIKTMMRSLTA